MNRKERIYVYTYIILAFMIGFVLSAIFLSFYPFQEEVKCALVVATVKDTTHASGFFVKVFDKKECNFLKANCFGTEYCVWNENFNECECFLYGSNSSAIDFWTGALK